MRVQIRKWGNSLAIRIPKSFALETNIDNGSFVDLTLDKGKLVATPVDEELSLKSLLSQVTEENIHLEVDTGEPVGKEVW